MVKVAFSGQWATNTPVITLKTREMVGEQWSGSTAASTKDSGVKASNKALAS